MELTSAYKKSKPIIDFIQSQPDGSGRYFELRKLSERWIKRFRRCAASKKALLIPTPPALTGVPGIGDAKQRVAQSFVTH